MTQENNVYQMTEVYEKFDDAPNKKIPAIVERHPEFAEYLLSTADHEVWEYVHSVSKFYINRYSQLLETGRMPSAKFWHKNRVTQLLFYRLIERTASMVAEKNVKIGLPQLELIEFLSTSCRVSERTVGRTIDEAVELGFIEKTTWWRDERITVCFLSPQSIAEYLEVGVMRHFRAAWSAGLSEANQRFDEVLEKTDERQLDFDFSQYV
jgi:hypothetical protein